MGTRLFTIQQTLKMLKGIHNKVTYLKVTRHKSTNKQIREYCTNQIAKITTNAEIQK